MQNRKITLSLSWILIVVLLVTYSCKQKPSEQTVSVTLPQTVLDGSGEVYQVDTALSVIEWVGSTPGNYRHNGILKLKEGQLSANKNQLTSGNFTIDINSITNLDQTGKDKSNLESHLKEKDFFEVEKYPFGSFEIINLKSDSSRQVVLGNLTLKNISHSIEIPVTIKIDSIAILIETPSFSIDRTKWGIVYNSGIIGTLKDDLINDLIELKIKLHAHKM